MKILFIAGWYPRKENPVGGIFVREHAKAVSLYNDVVVLFARQVDSFRNNHCEQSDKIEHGIRTIRKRYRKPLPKTQTLVYVYHILRMFRKFLKEEWKPDIIHAHICRAGIPAVIIGKLFRIPVVITEHSSAFPRRLLSKKVIKKVKFSMDRAHMILPVSNALRKGIESYGIKNRFQIIPNVVDTNLFHPDGQIKKDINVKRILLVALLTPIKGVPYLLWALHILKKKRNDFFLDIVGDGPNREEYERLSVELGIDDKVCFHGIKSKQEVAEFMRKGHFFVLPSLGETFGVVLIEAMASGLPIIATQVGGIPEIVNEKLGILVPSKDPEALAEAIENMLDHFHEYPVDRLAEHAQQTYSYEAIGRMLNKVYIQICRN